MHSSITSITLWNWLLRIKEFDSNYEASIISLTKYYSMLAQFLAVIKNWCPLLLSTIGSNKSKDCTIAFSGFLNSWAADAKAKVLTCERLFYFSYSSHWVISLTVVSFIMSLPMSKFEEKISNCLVWFGVSSSSKYTPENDYCIYPMLDFWSLI